MKTYYATRGGAVLGVHREAGEAVPVTEKQAKYLAEPYGDSLTHKKPRQPEAKTTKSK